MKQRLCFAKTLLHEPKVLCSMNPLPDSTRQGRLEFRELLKQLYAMGRTILISSHILTEMADFCTSIAIMEEGRLLASGRVDEILDASATCPQARDRTVWRSRTAFAEWLLSCPAWNRSPGRSADPVPLDRPPRRIAACSIVRSFKRARPSFRFPWRKRQPGRYLHAHFRTSNFLSGHR